MSTAVMSQPFTVTSHHSNPVASSNQSSITTPAGKFFFNNYKPLLYIILMNTVMNIIKSNRYLCNLHIYTNNTFLWS